MPIAFLKPTAENDGSGIIASGVLADVDEGVSGADGAEECMDVNFLGGMVAFWDMENLPGDADSVNSVILRVRGRVAGGWTDDIITYQWTILGTNGGGASVSWDFETEDGDALVNKQSTVTDSPTVANVNAFQVQGAQSFFDQIMSPDAGFHCWDAFELEVDYSTAGINLFRRRLEYM